MGSSKSYPRDYKKNNKLNSNKIMKFCKSKEVTRSKKNSKPDSRTCSDEQTVYLGHK